MLATLPKAPNSESVQRGRKMRLSKRCEYGIRALVHLAQRQPQGYTQSREIAETESIPAKFLESILLSLRSGSFLDSKVGAGGGYRLAKAPENIRLLDIVAILDPNDSNFSAAPEPAASGSSHASPASPRSSKPKSTGPCAGATGATTPNAIAIVNARLDEALLKALGQLDLATLAALSTPDSGQNPQFESRVVCC